jgi:uncharacterized C2H2 Zn-finger protein
VKGWSCLSASSFQKIKVKKHTFLFIFCKLCIYLFSVVSGFLKSIDNHQNARHTLSETVEVGSATEYKIEVNSQPWLAREINFSCLRCGSIYKYKRDWTRHVKFECDQKPQFYCTHCVSCFTRKSSLMRHVMKFHHINSWSYGA